MSMSEPLIEKDFLVSGLRRSGNHAIINWIISNLSGEGHFLNDLRPLDSDSKEQIPNNFAQIDQLDWLIHSYEDIKLNYLKGRLYRQWQDRHLGKSQTRKNILILRDPFNLLASRLHGNQSGQIRFRTGKEGFGNIWKMYAAEYLGNSHFLKDRVSINYSEWKSDSTYRLKIAEKLGLSSTNTSLGGVSEIGGGSSFEQAPAEKSGEQLKTDERWQRYRDNPDFLNVFRDRELLDLALKIFKLSDELKSFIEEDLYPNSSSLYSIKSNLYFRAYRPVAEMRMLWRHRHKV